MNKTQINYVKDRLEILANQKIRKVNENVIANMSKEEKIGQIISGKAKFKDIDTNNCPAYLNHLLQGFEYEGEDIIKAKQEILARKKMKLQDKIKKDRDKMLDDFVLNGRLNDSVLKEFADKEYEIK